MLEYHLLKHLKTQNDIDMYLTIEELRTHMREEYTKLVSRDDQTLVTSAIDGAIAEARSYLSDYDTNYIFSCVEDDRNALLLIFVKDIAVYHFINLCGAGSFYERREKRYDGAIAWLKGVQKGIIIPDLPKLTNQDGAKPSPIHLSSNIKRGNHF